MWCKSLLSTDERLNQDGKYAKAAADFLECTGERAAFVRVETSLMVALGGTPKGG